GFHHVHTFLKANNAIDATPVPVNKLFLARTSNDVKSQKDVPGNFLTAVEHSSSSCAFRPSGLCSDPPQSKRPSSNAKHHRNPLISRVCKLFHLNNCF